MSHTPDQLREIYDRLDKENERAKMAAATKEREKKLKQNEDFRKEYQAKKAAEAKSALVEFHDSIVPVSRDLGHLGYGSGGYSSGGYGFGNHSGPGHVFNFNFAPGTLPTGAFTNLNFGSSLEQVQGQGQRYHQDPSLSNSRMLPAGSVSGSASGSVRAFSPSFLEEEEEQSQQEQLKQFRQFRQQQFKQQEQQEQWNQSDTSSQVSDDGHNGPATRASIQQMQKRTEEDTCKSWESARASAREAMKGAEALLKHC